MRSSADDLYSTNVGTPGGDSSAIGQSGGRLGALFFNPDVDRPLDYLSLRVSGSGGVDFYRHGSTAGAGGLPYEELLAVELPGGLQTPTLRLCVAIPSVCFLHSVIPGGDFALSRCITAGSVASIWLMRRLFATSSLLAVLALCPVSSRAEFLLKENDMLAICGDSITNMKPYPAFVADYLLMCQPVPGLHVQQFGISGEKASGLLARMDAVVLPFKPTVVSICYGMNDGAYKEPDPAIVETFRANETELLQRFKAAGVRTGVLNSPGASDPRFLKKTADYNLALAGLRDVARDVAAKEGFAFADLHSLMLATMESSKKGGGEAEPLAGGDGVHPSQRGHLVMAYGVLKALGCDGAIGTFTVDLGKQSAQASEGHKILSCNDGKVEIESSRYPFCFVEPGSKVAVEKSLEGILPHLPFNQDLNRFLLVVKNLTGHSAKITWGGQSKVFSKEDLEKGVNLAAEFPSNPFSEPFFRVHEAVKKQQSNWGETMRKVANPLVKEADKAKADQAQKEFIATDAKAAREVQALVVPVKHQIQIEPQG